MFNGNNQVTEIEQEWRSPRWEGITRAYTAEDVARLRGSIRIEYTLARMGAERLWKLMHEKPYVRALGALTGNQAMQQVKAGLDAIYLSGWQVAADANLAGQMYPDQSLYPADSVPHVVKRINQALQRADQIHHADHEFLTGERTAEGFYRTRAGLDQAIARGLAYAPYADLVWCETGTPDR